MDLKDLRKNIDAVDAVIVEQFQKRMEIAKQIAEYKKEHDLPVKDEGRENEKLEEIVKLADDKMATYCRMLYNNILEMSRDYQRRSMNLGKDMLVELDRAFADTPSDLPTEENAACHIGQEQYCRQACQMFFGNDNHIKYFEDLNSIFEAVKNGECRYAVIAIGKQIDVSNKTYEMLAVNQCYIVRSFMMPGGIRFVCISNHIEIYPESDSTCLMMRIADVPGALYGVLDKFYALGLNISKLKSWTAPDNEDDLMFCFDVEVHFGSDDFKSMMEQIAHAEQKYVYLGSYMEIKNE